MASKTDIANIALSKLQAPHVTDINDADDSRARELAFHFKQAVTEAGSRTRFRCLKKWATLSESGTPPDKWSTSFALPPNFLRLNTFNQTDVYDSGVDEHFELDAKFLYTDEDSATIEYNEYTDNTGLYEPLFVECIACLLAAKAAPKVLGSGEAVPALLQAYEAAIGQAARVSNSQTQRRSTINEILHGSQMLKARRISTNG